MADTNSRMPGTLENGVLFGEAGHLFLADGGHAVLDFVTGRRQITAESVAIFAGNILSRWRVCAAVGVPFVHVIFPDKQSVLVEQFPYPDPICLGERYLAARPEIAPHIIYPRAELRAIGDGSFQKTDTHLTDLGTVVVTKAVLDYLFKKSHVEETKNIISGIKASQDWIGDLGGRFEPKLKETRLFYNERGSLMWFHNSLTGGNNGIVDILLNKNFVYNKRVLIFGDSFGRELARFMGFFVKEVIFLRTPYFHQEMFEQIAPDIVISDNVERYLSSCMADEARPAFMLYPYLGSGVYAPSKEFAEAFSALLSFPRKPYKEFMRKFEK
jgi:hypothetical protein